MKWLFSQSADFLAAAMACLSIVWIFGTAFIYFNGITKYPKSIIEQCHIPLHDFFDSEEDYDRTIENLTYAKLHGKEEEAKAFLATTGFNFVKPVFRLTGFMSLVFLPVVYGWLIFFIFLYYRRYLGISIASYILYLLLGGLTVVLIFVFMCVGIGVLICLLLERLLYKLAFIISSAKKDAHREIEKEEHEA